MPSRKLKIVIPSGGGALWTGGITYIANLLSALNKYAVDDLEIINFQVLITRKKINNPYLSYLSDITSTVLPAAGRKLFGIDYKLQNQIDTIAGKDTDLVFNISTYLRNNIASLVWLPDFQQLHLPEMFSEEEVAGRNVGFMDSAKRATLIILSSNDAFYDYSNFAPSYAHKGRVMHFVASVPDSIYDENPAEMCRIYNIPDKFLFLPNQFWKHKNHEAVFKALQILKSDNIKPFLVCSGNISDYRNPTFLSELIQKLSLYNIREQVAFLGLVPHLHVYQLMRQSAFVINPSFFEGWSTTVEEAKSIGKKILLSNINVHLEQNPPGAEYFDPSNPNELEYKIKELWMSSKAGPDIKMEEDSRDQLPDRMKIFAETFVNISKEAFNIVRNI